MLNISYLPQFPTRYKDKMYINGRNVYEGYQRGWGLRYGDLVEKVGKDKLYEKSVSKVRNVCILSEAKLMNIFLILNFFTLPLSLLPGAKGIRQSYILFVFLQRLFPTQPLGTPPFVPLREVRD